MLSLRTAISSSRGPCNSCRAGKPLGSEQCGGKGSEELRSRRILAPQRAERTLTESDRFAILEFLQGPRDSVARVCDSFVSYTCSKSRDPELGFRRAPRSGQQAVGIAKHMLPTGSACSSEYRIGYESGGDPSSAPLA